MKKVLISMIFGCIALVGCSSKEEIAEKQKNPEITNLGVFNECEVSYVDRYYDSQSFFMAKCPSNSTTITNKYTVQSGKTQTSRTRTTIIQEIGDLQKELNDVSQKELKEKALSKLTPEEIEAIKLQ